MPTRKFCDLCDEKIENTTTHFSIVVDSQGRDHYQHNDFFDQESETRHSITVDNSMVCHNCIIAIRTTMLGLSNNALQKRETT